MALPALIGGWVAAAIATSIGAIIAKAMLALGIGYVTYTFGMPGFIAFIQSQFSGVPADVIAVFAYAKVDVAITIILSAVSARMAMRLIFRRI